MASSSIPPEDEAVLKEFSKILCNRETPLCCLVKDDHTIAEGKMCSECLTSVISVLADMLKQAKQEREKKNG